MERNKIADMMQIVRHLRSTNAVEALLATNILADMKEDENTDLITLSRERLREILVRSYIEGMADRDAEEMTEEINADRILAELEASHD